MRRRCSALLGAAAALALSVSGPASASPSIWERARVPELDRRAVLVAEAEVAELKYHKLMAGPVDRHTDLREIQILGEAYLTRAAELLEQAGTATSGEPMVRFQLAEIYGLLGRHDRSQTLLEALLATKPPAVVRAMAYGELALCYARVGRPQDEIHAYTEALAGQPLIAQRSRLLANRAEAYMLTGDITAAVEGYREALASLSPEEMFSVGPTTLWGLGVALDRSGDLEAGLESIVRARTYDAKDLHLSSSSWFYVPDYDRYWYAALGHWMAARKTEVGSVRIDAFGRAVAAWRDYLANAAKDDRWVGIARVRLRQCEKESEEARRRAKVPPRRESKGPARRPGG